MTFKVLFFTLSLSTMKDLLLLMKLNGWPRLNKVLLKKILFLYTRTIFFFSCGREGGEGGGSSPPFSNLRCFPLHHGIFSSFNNGKGAVLLLYHLFSFDIYFLSLLLVNFFFGSVWIWECNYFSVRI